MSGNNETDLNTNVLADLAGFARQHFTHLLRKAPEIYPDGLVLTIKDNSILEVRYPKPEEYSFNWVHHQKGFRIDTAPGHRDLGTFPNHLHQGNEVIPDPVTAIGNSPTENLGEVLVFLEQQLKTRSKELWIAAIS